MQQDYIEPEKALETEQPEGVETEQEIDAPSIESEVEEVEVSINVEDEPENEQDVQDKVARGFNKLRRKNKAVKSENEQLKQELAELRNQVGSISRGDKPSILDYTSDTDYEAALSAWQGGNNTPQQPQVEAQQQQAPQPYSVSDDIIESHYNRAAQLGLKDYEQSEGTLRNNMSEAFGEQMGQSLTDEVIRMSGDKSQLVAYALGANGGKRANTLINKLQRDNQNGTDEAMEYIFNLKKSAKVEKKTKNLTNQPEVIPQGRGNADALQTQVKQAYDKWLDSGSASDHQKYKALKKQTSK